ncbi:MAG: lysophospholipid acyltransferase family protein [Acidobacteriota bacterium]
MEDRFRRLPDRFYFSGLLPALSLLPRRQGYFMARMLGRHFSRTHPIARERIVRSLCQAIGSKPPGFENCEVIARDFFENLSCEDLDAFYYPFWKEGNLHDYFAFEGLENLDRAEREGRGALLLTGHVGAVCAALVALGLKGYRVTHLAREYAGERSLPAPFRAYALKKVTWIESKIGRPLIYADARDRSGSSEAVLRIYQALLDNQMVSMAIDVHPEWVQDTATVTFLGRRARFATNLVRLAHRCQAPVIPYFIIRDRRDWWRHRLWVAPPLELTGNLDQDLQTCIDQLAETIRRHPEQWFSWDSLSHFWVP